MNNTCNCGSPIVYTNEHEGECFDCRKTFQKRKIDISEAAANVAIAWIAGVVIGVGAATGAIEMMVAGTVLTVLSLYYYHRFVNPKENEHDL